MYGGFYRMDSAAPPQRPYYGYPGAMMPMAPTYNAYPAATAGRGSMYNGGGVPMNGARGGMPYSGAYTGNAAAPAQRGAKPMGPVGQLGRGNSFTLGHGNGGQPPQSLGSFGSAFGSFRGGGYNGGPPSNGSTTSSADPNLPRVNSGLNFGYSFGSFAARPMSAGAGANTSLMDMNGSMRAANTSGYGGHPAGGAANGNDQLSRQSSLYSYGSFANGLPGMGPGSSFNSTAPAPKLGGGDTSSNNSTASRGSTGGPNTTAAAATSDDGDIFNLQRQDSQNQLQRQYSIAGQFHNFGATNGGMGMGMGMGAPNPFGGVRSGVMLNGRNGGVLPGAGMNRGFGGPMQMGQHPPYPQQQQQQQQQRRLAAGGMKGGGDVVQEGETTLLGRKNSMSNVLERKESQKRVGMYFKNKEATQEDVEYKKDGDPGTTKTASSKARDPSLVNNVKPILLFDTIEDGNAENEIEVDGNTVRAVKPGNDEVQKYDMREIIFVNVAEDVEVNGSSLDELRDNFFNGANCSMLMADAEGKAAEPTEWFTWTALKTVMKNVFAKIQNVRSATANSSSYSPTFEVTVSLSVLQDDEMLDLLGDDSNFDTGDYRLEPLVVAESPLFGNVPNNAVFVVVENADEFNDTLDACLERARGFFSQSSDDNKNLDDVEEYGIILATCVLKQTRKSTSSGKMDVVVSSIFASGVGDGIIHYNRIMDKNPAEPRALFYSVLHRSCYSTAVFSLKKKNPDIFNSLNTLQRFSKVELRKPKLGSVRQFLYYSEATLPKIKEDLAKMKEGKQKVQTQRFKERLELMAQDMEQMLEDPEGCVPKTYI